MNRGADHLPVEGTCDSGESRVRLHSALVLAIGCAAVFTRPPPQQQSTQPIPSCPTNLGKDKPFAREDSSAKSDLP